MTGRITTWRRCLKVSTKSSLVKWKLRSMNWVTSEIKSKEKRRTERKKRSLAVLTKWWFDSAEERKQSRTGFQERKRKYNHSLPRPENTVVNSCTHLCAVDLSGIGQFYLCVKWETANSLYHRTLVASEDIELLLWVHRLLAEGSTGVRTTQPKKKSPWPWIQKGGDKRPVWK